MCEVYVGDGAFVIYLSVIYDSSVMVNKHLTSCELVPSHVWANNCCQLKKASILVMSSNCLTVMSK